MFRIRCGVLCSSASCPTDTLPLLIEVAAATKTQTVRPVRAVTGQCASTTTLVDAGCREHTLTVARGGGNRIEQGWRA
jgi:hypothetical protein